MRYRLRWQGLSALLETDEPDLIADAARFLALRAEPTEDADDAASEAALAVRRIGAAYELSSPYGEKHGLDRKALLYLLLETIGHDFMEQSDAAIVHAGAFARAGEAIAYFGLPRTGKTSLSYAAWRRGLTVIGDDRTVLDAARGRVEAFPKCVKVRVDSEEVDLFQALGLTAREVFVAQVGRERRLVLARSLPRMAGYEAAYPLAALVWLARAAGSGAALEPLSASAALPLFLGQVIPPDPAPMAFLRLLKRMAKAGRALALNVGEGAVEEALDLLCGL